MSSSMTFQNLAEGIVAGTVGSEDIAAKACSEVDALEKQALYNLLATELADKSRTLALSNELKGGAATGTLVVPPFVSGFIVFDDTDNTAQTDQSGTTEIITDSDGDVFVEGSKLTWPNIDGKFYKGRTLTIPAGVKATYHFVLAS